jgi:hypothetical protein
MSNENLTPERIAGPPSPRVMVNHPVPHGVKDLVHRNLESSVCSSNAAGGYVDPAAHSGKRREAA